MTPPLSPNLSSDSNEPLPETPLDAALLLTVLRRQIVAWRERASVAHEREAHVYRRAEEDIAAVIARHSETRSCWEAARRDLVRALVAALDEREGSPPGGAPVDP